MVGVLYTMKLINEEEKTSRLQLFVETTRALYFLYR